MIYNFDENTKTLTLEQENGRDVRLAYTWRDSSKLNDSLEENLGIKRKDVEHLVLNNKFVLMAPADNNNFINLMSNLKTVDITNLSPSSRDNGVDYLSLKELEKLKFVYRRKPVDQITRISINPECPLVKLDVVDKAYDGDRSPIIYASALYQLNSCPDVSSVKKMNDYLALKNLAIQKGSFVREDSLDEILAKPHVDKLISYLGKEDTIKSPVIFLARNEDEFKYITKLIKDGVKLDYPSVYNAILEAETSERELKDIDLEKVPNLAKESPEDIEELLNKLKNRELTASFADFHEYDFDKTRVTFFDANDKIIASVKIKKLDERFKRFIKGVLKVDGSRVTFQEYVNEFEGPKANIFLRNSLSSCIYSFANCALNGFLPDKTLLEGVSRKFYHDGAIDIPDLKGLWRLYNSSEYWGKDENTVNDFLTVCTVFGVFESDEAVKQQGMNYLKAYMNHIPNKISIDGYTYAKKFTHLPKEEITRNSEITIKPGIPYGKKKAHKAILEILSQDEELMAIFSNDKDALEKFLKDVYPLAELMDAFSIYDMPEGTAKDIALRIMEDLYVVTNPVDVPIDKREFAGKEGKDKLAEFRKLTEKYANSQGSNMRCLNSQKAHALFNSLEPKYNKDFAKFLNNHMREILEDNAAWKMGGILKAIQSNWDLIQSKRLMNRREFKDTPAWKMSFNEIKDILSGINYTYEDEKYNAVAELCQLYSYTQHDFERCCEIYDVMCAKETTIPDVSGAYENYTYKMLSLDDPAAMFFGQILDCCQQLSGAGESCMIHSCKEPNGRVFAVFDSEGVMVAGSWVWRNGDTICFDNIEAANHPDVDTIIKAYAQASNELLTKAKEGDHIHKITAGQGYSDVSFAGFDRDNVNKYPIERERVSYLSDSRTQYVLATDGLSEEGIDFMQTYEAEETEHVNASLGESYSSYSGRRNETENAFLRNDPRDDPDYEGDEDEEEEEEEYCEHDPDVINDDIYDHEIIDRILHTAEHTFDVEEEVER